MSLLLWNPVKIDFISDLIDKISIRDIESVEVHHFIQ